MQPCGRVNVKIKKDVAKVVDSVDIEDISEKAVFCRCWKSDNVSSVLFLKLKCKYISFDFILFLNIYISKDFINIIGEYALCNK